MLFDVVAKQYGDSVTFELEVDEKPEESDEIAVYKSARQKAKEHARTIFDYRGTGAEPTISVKKQKEQVVSPKA